MFQELARKEVVYVNGELEHHLILRCGEIFHHGFFPRVGRHPWRLTAGNIIIEVDGSDHFPFSKWVISRFQPLIFQGCKVTFFKGLEVIKTKEKQLFGMVIFNENTSLPNCMWMFFERVVSKEKFREVLYKGNVWRSSSCSGNLYGHFYRDPFCGNIPCWCRHQSWSWKCIPLKDGNDVLCIYIYIYTLVIVRWYCKEYIYRKNICILCIYNIYIYIYSTYIHQEWWAITILGYDMVLG